MDTSYQEYLEKMRAKGASDTDIKKTLQKNGWLQQEIDDLFASDGEPRVPTPPHKQTMPIPQPPHDRPVAVVQRYTTVGLEYAIMFVSLGIGAVSLGALLHAWVENLTNTEPGWFGLSADISGIAAVVTLPIFLVLFLRLRRMEQRDPAVHNDSSRRRGVQLALIVSFIWGIQSIVNYLYNLLNGQDTGFYRYDYDTYTVDPGAYQIAQILHLVITLGIAGGIFAYYWIDEHRNKDRHS
jgi:MFS family permease